MLVNALVLRKKVSHHRLERIVLSVPIISEARDCV
jgi:hypothetical protein